MVVVGGRAPQNRWGTGSLQELDQPPIVGSVSKHAATLPTAADPAPSFPRGLEEMYDGITPLRTPASEFYRVDTRLTVPTVGDQGELPRSLPSQVWL